MRPLTAPKMWGYEEAIRLMKQPSTYAGIILLFIASILVSLPGMPQTSKDFLVVAFACVALMPGK